MLVLGAGGWFGSTMLELCSGLPDTQVMAIASRARAHVVADRPWNLVDYDADAIERFAPTMVLNFAFLTRERIEIDGLTQFQRVNAQLTEQFLQAVSLPSVRIGLTVSSGAAVTEPGEPYGAMKLAEERAALARASAGRYIVVARAYSVTGPYVRRPSDYAFSDMIAQARRGVIKIRATTPVFRRYLSVRDVLEVCLLRGLAGFTGVIETGGPLVEMGELAQIVRTVVNPSATVTRPELTTTTPSTYASDDVSWIEACHATGAIPMTLDAQVAAVAAGLARTDSR